MGHVSLNTTVESTFATAWGVTTSIKYENVPFTPPVGSAWVIVMVREGDSKKISLGSGLQRRRTIGTIFLDIFTPLGTGSLQARQLADTAKAIFRDLRVSGIHCYEGGFTPRGEVYYTNSGTGVPATSQWYQGTLAIPFKYDENL